MLLRDPFLLPARTTRLHGALFELPDATASDRPVVSIDGRTLATILRGVPK
jgi:hypothetical protein